MIRGSSVTNNSLETSTVSHSMAVASSPVVVNSSSLASNMSSVATMATKRKLIDESEAKADVKKVMTETIFRVELLYDGVYVKWGPKKNYNHVYAGGTFLRK